MPHVGLPHFLTVAALLFALGIYAVITRRNVVMVLIGVELILGGAGINLVAFARYNVMGFSNAVSGQTAALLVVLLACCEIAVAIAIALNLYRRFRTADPDRADMLRD